MKQLLAGEQVNFQDRDIPHVVNASDDLINEKYTKGEVRIITEQARYPLNTILTLVRSPEYRLNPEFQRRHRWTNDKKSRLIESFIMNVPIPPIFLYEIEYSTYEVMDGLQRMTAISQFYANGFPLEGLEEWPELNGRTYSSLPEQIRKGIDRRYLSSIILLQETAKSEEEARRLKQLVFERINSGGEKINKQESRNALYPGSLNKLCISLARHSSFCKLWGIPEPDETELETEQPSAELIKHPFFSKMEDVELVLRFFAYRQIEKWDSATLETFLDEFLQKGNHFSSGVLDEFGRIFKETTDLILEIYGEKGFWLYRERQGNKRGTEWILYERPTKVLYDPLMYVVSDLLPHKEKLLKAKNEIVKNTEQVHKDNYPLLEGRSTNRNDVIKRIEVFQKFFAQVLMS